MAYLINNLEDLREFAREITLPKGYNWRFCRKCLHFAEAIKWNDIVVKGRFCPHMELTDRNKRMGTIDCDYFDERTTCPTITYMRECAPRVIDADRFF